MDRIRRDQVIDLQRDLVRVPSYTTEEEPLARVIFGHMQRIGLKARLDRVLLGENKQSFNVVGEIPGRSTTQSLLFVGHMDHAPALGRDFDDLSLWSRPPFEGIVEGDWFYGKGAQDEKGGLCAMLTAAKALLEEGFQPSSSIYFVAVQGHKRVSSGARQLLASGLRPAYAINAENSGNTIVPSWVGRADGRVHVRARAGGRELHFHFKEIDPSLRGRLSVFEHTARLLKALGPEMSPPQRTGWFTYNPVDQLPGYPQYRIEKIETKSQMHVVVSFQIRNVSGQTAETLQQDLLNVLDRLRAEDPTTDMELEFPTAPMRPGVDIPHDHPLVHALASAHETVRGSAPEISGRGRLGAAADGSLFAAAGIVTVLYGPGGGDSDNEYQQAAHEGRVPPDERVSISSIMDAAKVFALTAVRLQGQKEGL